MSILKHSERQRQREREGERGRQRERAREGDREGDSCGSGRSLSLQCITLLERYKVQMHHINLETK